MLQSHFPESSLTVIERPPCPQCQIRMMLVRVEPSLAGPDSVRGAYSQDGTRTLYREKHSALACRPDWRGRHGDRYGNNGLRGSRQGRSRQTRPRSGANLSGRTKLASQQSGRMTSVPAAPDLAMLMIVLSPRQRCCPTFSSPRSLI